ncbi:MAG: ketoacyl-ACP synthase III [Spirochaetes bacterium]|nr:ketoacyl-ACP synthase III [Spirochaetota bacterium]
MCKRRCSVSEASKVRIAGVGSHVPERILTNKDLEAMVETSDEWITSRTGIRERHIAADGEPSSSLGIAAAQAALKDAGISAEELDLIIVATITPDYIYPSTASILQQALGATRAVAYDIEAACSGFIYGITIGEQYIASGRAEKVLVVAAETLSKITDWQDRNTCVLFGDGAGAAVLTRAVDDSCILSSYIGGDGAFGELLYMPAGGSLNPASERTVLERMHYMKMSGNEVFRAAVNAMNNAASKAMAMAGITSKDVDLIIPHQANMRIIQSVAKFMEVDMAKVYVNLDRFGNTSAATIGIALREAMDRGVVKKGSVVAMVAFGGGFTWGSLIFRC